MKMEVPNHLPKTKPKSHDDCCNFICHNNDRKKLLSGFANSSLFLMAQRILNT